MLLDCADYAAVLALKIPVGLQSTNYSILWDWWILIQLVADFHVDGLPSNWRSVLITTVESVRRAEQYRSTEVRGLLSPRLLPFGRANRCT